MENVWDTAQPPDLNYEGPAGLTDVSCKYSRNQNIRREMRPIEVNWSTTQSNFED